MRKKYLIRLAALLCAVCLLLTGCSSDLRAALERLTKWDWPSVEATEETEETEPLEERGLSRYKNVPSFDEMLYSRPDMEEFQSMVSDLVEAAKAPKSARQLADLCLDVYDFYDEFYTMYSLADIHYSLDLTDPYYKEEYAYCAEQSAIVDQGLEKCYVALANSGIVDELEADQYFGEGFFDSYLEGGAMDEELTGMMTRESTLVSEFYALQSELAAYEYYSDEYFEAGVQPLGELLVELVTLRQQMAAYMGYDTYSQFAFEYFYERDYDPGQADAYLLRIQEELVPMYRELNESGFWRTAYQENISSRDCQVFLRDVTKTLGDPIRSAYRLMETRDLFDLERSASKYSGSFEVYLTSFGAPYVFVNPTGDSYDVLTFAHEFGHFANDLFCGGTYVTTDVAEFFSQGMEYLSLCCASRDLSVDLEQLRRLKMADSLNTYVEQSAYALFEDRIYSMSPEELTVENLAETYREICLDYGFDSWNWDERDFITINHFFTSPFYIFSYVTSNDAAMQLFEMEMAEPGSGRELYGEYVTGCSPYFMEFMEETGLQSPFDPERLIAVRETIQNVLGDL